MSETGDRTAFLRVVGDRVTTPPPANLAHPSPGGGGEPPIVEHLDLDPEDLVGTFQRAATRVEARVHPPGFDVLATLVEEHHVGRAVVTAEPGLEAATEALRAAGVTVEPYSVEAGATAGLGLTGAVAGVAATGSLVLDAAVAGGRGAGLLPRVHVCVLPIDRLVPTTAEVFAPLQGHPERLPSNLVLVTGPSRTGDIEQILTLGVHGPVAVEILLSEPV